MNRLVNGDHSARPPPGQLIHLIVELGPVINHGRRFGVGSKASIRRNYELWHWRGFRPGVGLGVRVEGSVEVRRPVLGNDGIDLSA